MVFTATNTTLQSAVNGWCNGSITASTPLNGGTYGAIGNWNVTNVTNMDSLFSNRGDYFSPKGKFNDNISNWDVSNVTSMYSMFYGAILFNQPIGNWDVSNVVYMGDMFSYAQAFNQPIGNWDISNVMYMDNMFIQTPFNQDISGWKTGNVKSMEAMFRYNSVFNQDIGNWDVRNLENIGFMFHEATAFNNGGSSSISNWKTGNLKDIRVAFNRSNFNQPIGKWDVSNVIQMDGMFGQNTSFAQSIREWKVNTTARWANLTYNMFYGANGIRKYYEGTDLFNNSPSPTEFFNLGYSPSRITINGDSTVTVEAKSTYVDAGATAINTNGDVLTSSITSNIADLNTDIIGPFTLRYDLNIVGQDAISRTRTVIVQDTIRPVITLLGDETVTIIVHTAYSDEGATAYDNFDGVITDNITSNIADLNTGIIGPFTLRYNVSDTAGNEAYEVTRTVNVVDSPPGITLLGDNPVFVNIDDVYDDAGSTATDILDGNLTSAIRTYTGDVNTKTDGTYQVTYNVTNSVGLTSNEVTRTVIVLDPYIPAIHLNGLSTVTVEKGSTYDISVDAGATASDKIDGDLVIGPSNISGLPLDTSTVGTHIVTYNITNTQGNKAKTVTRTVNVVDEPPVITLKGSSSVLVDIDIPYIDAGATASDSIDGDLTGDITSNIADLDTSIIGPFTLRYNVSDTAGLAAVEVTRTVIVTDPYIPTIVLNYHTPVKIEKYSLYTDAGATATDHIDGNITNKITYVSNVNTSKVGTYTVIYTVTNNEGNTARATRFVNVVDEPPVITLIGDNRVTVDYGKTYTDAGATAGDSVDGDLTLYIQTNIADLDTTTVGQFTLTYNVSDNSGLAAVEVTRTIIVHDPYPPTITMKGQTPVKIEKGSTYSDAGATASDHIDGDITDKMITDVSNVNTAELGTYIVTYSVTDNEGNKARASRYVNVVYDPPVITLIDHNPVSVDYGKIYTDAGATASDSIDGDLTADITTNIADLDTTIIGPFTLRYNVSDTAGLAAVEVTRTIFVHDQYYPTITLKGKTPVKIEKDSTYSDAGATATDHLDGDITDKMITDVSNIDTSIVGQYTVIYTVADEAGNITNATRIVDVVYDPPVITLIGNNPVTIDYGKTYTDSGATANDSVDGDLTDNITTNIGDLNTEIVGDFTLRYNVNDPSGLAAVEVTRTIIVHDPYPPTITMKGDSPVKIEKDSIYNINVDAGATASDTVDGDITGNITYVSDVNTSIVGTYSVIYTVKDEANNTATATRIVKVVDEPPVITLIGNNPVTVNYGQTYTDAGATASDSIDGDLSTDITSNIADLDTNIVGDFILRYNVIDTAGLAADEVTRTIIVHDPYPPTITLKGDITVNIELGSSYVDEGATANDTIDGDLTDDIISNIADLDTNTIGQFIVTYNVTDAEGNSATEATRTINVVDSPPVITLIGSNPVTVDYGKPYNDDGATASDYIDGDLSADITTNIDDLDTNTIGQFILRYNVNDNAGLAAVEVTRTIIVHDQYNPIITLKGDTDINIELHSIYDKYVDEGATAWDKLSGEITNDIITTGLPLDTNTIGQFTITYNVTDINGNSASEVTRTVNVVNVPPEITILGANPVTFECKSTVPYKDAGATASDNIDGDLTENITSNIADLNTEIVGQFIVTYNVNDIDGNAATPKTRTINVVDLIKPGIIVSGSNPVIIEINSVYNDAGATSFDIVSGNLTAGITANNVDFDTSIAGTHIITYSSTDESNNMYTAFRTVIVKDSKPLITLIGDNIVTVNLGVTYNDAGATAGDDIDGDLTSKITTHDLVNTNKTGTYTVTYNVIDNAGNAADEVTRTVIVHDQYIPTIGINGKTPVSVERYSHYNDLGATAWDKIDGDITTDIKIVNPVNTNKVGTYIVTYNVTDAEGNKAKTVTRTVNVVDVPPVIKLNGLSILSVDLYTTYVDPGATASDYIDGNLTSVITTYNPVNTNKAGTYIVTYNVQEVAGITAAEVTRTVTVIDQYYPVIVIHGETPITIEQNSNYLDMGALATDKVDGVLSVDVGGLPIDTSKVGTYIVTYNVTNTQGNKAKTVTRTVNVVDVLPVIKLIGDNIVTVDLGVTYKDAGATAADDVDGDLTSSIITYNPVDTGKFGIYHLTYNVKDVAGIAAVEVTRTVVVHDQYVPTILRNGQTPVTVEQNSQYNDLGATAWDKVDGDLTGQIKTVNHVDTSKVGTYIVTYNVTDAEGNKAKTVTRTVYVVDVSPVIKLIGEKLVTVDLGVTYKDAGATAGDNVDGDLTSAITTYNPVDTSKSGTYNITYNVKDVTGLAAIEVTRTVVVHDPYIPTIIRTGQTPVTVEQNSHYNDLGATAWDKIDGDITGEITTENTVDTSKVGTYIVTYNVTDAEGNKANTVTRTVYVVDAPPVIKLIGENPAIVELGVIYKDAGATAGDNVDGDLTSSIITYNPVDTSKWGTYIITYNVKDAAGLAAVEVTRTVIVQHQYLPIIVGLGKSPVTVEQNSQYNDPGATAWDKMDGDLTGEIKTVNHVNTSKVGTYVVTYNVTDSEGYIAKTVTRTVYVVDHTLRNSVLGGPYTGYSPKQTLLNYKHGAQASTRSILRRGWNTSFATGTVNGQNRVITPFRAVNNSGDFLARNNYKCGGPTGMSKSSIGWARSKIFLGSKIDNCDNSDVPGASGNVKYVYDSSNYITYKRQQAVNQNYNDIKN